MEIYDVRKIFTPASPAVLTFIERESINDRLFDALNTTGKQVVVYGHSGSGKSTLLRNKLYQTHENHKTTRCMIGLTFDDLLLDAFDQLAPFYVAERTNTATTMISSSIQADYMGLRSQMGAQMSDESKSVQRRILPPQLTPQRLAVFFGEARCCWVLEDFHKIPEQEKKKLAQTMKIFMDMAVDYSDLKIIAIGAVGTARQVVAYDREMQRRVSEILVPLMTAKEIESIIVRGEELLNIQFPTKVKRNIVRYSNGLASVCHQLALNMCLVSGVLETPTKKEHINPDVFGKALEIYVADESDSTKALFDMAVKQRRKQKFDNCRLILGALAKCEEEDGMSRSEILDVITKTTPTYPPGNLNLYLKELQSEERGGLIRFDANSGKYTFPNPFHKVFARLLVEQAARERANQRRGPLSDLLDDALDALSRRISTDSITKALIAGYFPE